MGGRVSSRPPLDPPVMSPSLHLCVSLLLVVWTCFHFLNLCVSVTCCLVGVCVSSLSYLCLVRHCSPLSPFHFCKFLRGSALTSPAHLSSLRPHHQFLGSPWSSYLAWPSYFWLEENCGPLPWNLAVSFLIFELGLFEGSCCDHHM